MSGTTRTVQQPLDTHNVFAVLGMAAAAVAATIAIAWGSANLVTAAPAALSAPAAISDPVLRDLGARDLGAAAVSTGAIHGAPGAYRPSITSGGSSTLVKDDISSTTNAAAGFSLGYLGYADQLRMKNITSSEGAPATRHAGPRAQ